jgi:sRNA-binding protein
VAICLLFVPPGRDIYYCCPDWAADASNPKTQIESQRRVWRRPTGKKSEKSLVIATFSGVLVMGGLCVVNMGKGEKRNIVLEILDDKDSVDIDEKRG